MSNFNTCERVHGDAVGFINAVALQSSLECAVDTNGVDREALEADIVAQRCAQAIVAGVYKGSSLAQSDAIIGSKHLQEGGL